MFKMALKVVGLLSLGWGLGYATYGTWPLVHHQGALLLREPRGHAENGSTITREVDQDVLFAVKYGDTLMIVGKKDQPDHTVNLEAPGWNKSLNDLVNEKVKRVTLDEFLESFYEINSQSYSP